MRCLTWTDFEGLNSEATPPAQWHFDRERQHKSTACAGGGQRPICDTGLNEPSCSHDADSQ